MVVDIYEAALAKVLQAQEQASADFPATIVDGHRVHIFERDRQWEVWINTEDRDFDGICIAHAHSRLGAITKARLAVLSISGFLQTQYL